ncbi:AMP-binding protein [Aquihabitans sp. G128]|uniref:AMP-binding protein n=1 Tax=Aquihabitans sp. G128 TaxID=2849779 RepID=UPI001C22AC96|nr:AMP-binding protein [Aquihabitans sp. G128]QXC61104.1 AMP-binding protein [Aquihabitans sp. G128]
MAAPSFPRRLADLAEADPDALAITCAGASLTRGELVAAANRFARELADLGVAEGDLVTIALPNSVDFLVAVVAAWTLGATPQPVSSRLPERELAAIVELANPPVIVGAEPGAFPGRACLPVGHRPAADLDDGPMPDRTAPSWKAPTSGGSTGRPKLIVAGDPATYVEGFASFLGFTDGGALVMPGPMYHNGPFIWTCQALLRGSSVALLERFDAEATLAAVEAHHANVVYLVPTMMKRIWRLPEDVRDGYDLSSLVTVWHLAEPCPDWLKQVWIDWLGPERIFELYAGTEGQTSTIITGTDWLEHRGSVGRPAPGTMQITDADGNELPAGEHGEVWLRSARDTPTYRYVGAEARTREGGWESLGDRGWLDEDGYLHLGDRAGDMILTGGANVYPAEVEAAIAEHPAVRSCVVFGLPDDDKGNVVHAVVEADEAELDVEELLAFLRERLVAYKLPRTVEVVHEALRDDAGKVRRGELRSARIAALSAASPGA